MFPNRIRTFNKYVTNRIFGRFAKSSHGPFAVVQHVGRRSGKRYKTVIMIWPKGDGFVIALTYGPKVDWYRNVQAAGGCTVLWHKRLYKLGAPEPIDAKAALLAFPRFIKGILGRTGAKDFVWLKIIAPVRSQSQAAYPQRAQREGENP